MKGDGKSGAKGDVFEIAELSGYGNSPQCHEGCKNRGHRDQDKPFDRIELGELPHTDPAASQQCHVGFAASYQVRDHHRGVVQHGCDHYD